MPPISISSPREVGTSLAPGERVQHQQDGSSVVVDGRGGFGAGEAADQQLEMIVAIAAPALVEIELHVHRPLRGGNHGVHGFGGKGSAAEVRVQNRAGQIEHRPQRAARLIVETPPHAIEQCGLADGAACRAGSQLGPQMGQYLSNGVRHECAAPLADERLRVFQPKNAIDRRQFRE